MAPIPICLIIACMVYLWHYDAILGTAQGSKAGEAFYMAVAVFVSIVIVITFGLLILSAQGVV